MAFAVAAAFTMSAQDLDIEAIAKLRNIKADSLALMLGKVYGTQNAMNHTTSDARVALIKAFDESINIEKQDEQFREGSSLANEFFKVAQTANPFILLTFYDARIKYGGCYRTRTCDPLHVKQVL